MVEPQGIETVFGVIVKVGVEVLVITTLLIVRASNDKLRFPPVAHITKYEYVVLPAMVNCGILYVTLEVEVTVTY